MFVIFWPCPDVTRTAGKCWRQKTPFCLKLSTHAQKSVLSWSISLSRILGIMIRLIVDLIFLIFFLKHGIEHSWTPCIEWLGWLCGGVKLLKLAAFFANFPSLVRNIFYFFCGQGQIGSAPKSSWRQKQKIKFCPMHALYVCVLLASSEKRTRYCVQPRTGWAIFSLFCFVAPVLIGVMTETP